MHLLTCLLEMLNVNSICLVPFLLLPMSKRFAWYLSCSSNAVGCNLFAGILFIGPDSRITRDYRMIVLQAQFVQILTLRNVQQTTIAHEIGI